jgi:hypothetical protein
MDTRCRNCGEPYEIDYFHDVAEEHGTSFEEVRADFSRRGCVAVGGKCSSNKAHPAIGELTDLLGDDIDGLASMLEDFEYLL